MLRMGPVPARGSDTSITMSHKLSAGIPHILTQAPNEIISAPVLLCDQLYFLQVQLFGTNV